MSESPSGGQRAAVIIGIFAIIFGIVLCVASLVGASWGNLYIGLIGIVGGAVIVFRNLR